MQRLSQQRRWDKNRNTEQTYERPRCFNNSFRSAGFRIASDRGVVAMFHCGSSVLCQFLDDVVQA